MLLWVTTVPSMHLQLRLKWLARIWLESHAGSGMVLLSTDGCIEGMRCCGMHGQRLSTPPLRGQSKVVSKVSAKDDKYLKTAALFASTKSSKSRTKGRGSVGAFNHFSMPSLAARHGHLRELIATFKLLFLQHRLAFMHACTAVVSIESLVCA